MGTVLYYILYKVIKKHDLDHLISQASAVSGCGSLLLSILCLQRANSLLAELSWPEAAVSGTSSSAELEHPPEMWALLFVLLIERWLATLCSVNRLWSGYACSVSLCDWHTARLR